MKIDVSDILRTSGASLDVKFNDSIEDIVEVGSTIEFDIPIVFDGTLVNFDGILKLKGLLKIHYAVKCYRCLKDIDNSITIDIVEDIVSNSKDSDSEHYTYEGNFIVLDDILKDNIVLNLPMKQVCSENCRGLCPKCGIDFNTAMCGCKEETIDSRMEVLKNFFNN